MDWKERFGRDAMGWLLRLASVVAIFGMIGVESAKAETVECDSVRRLADNYLLDLRIRMILDYRRHLYIRYENTGRGWMRVPGVHRFARHGNDHLQLTTNEYVTSYLEPLAGTYYYIDRSGYTLSVWAHCGQVEALAPLF